MKRIMTSTIAVLLMTAPAFADDAAKKSDATKAGMDTADTVKSKDKTTAGKKTHKGESKHAPTNRVDKAVPTMSKPDKNAQAPTNRVGKAVPPMKADDEQADKNQDTSKQ